MALYTTDELIETLRELDIIPEIKLNETLKYCKEADLDFEDALISRDLISDENLGKVVADLIATPFVYLPQYSIREEILDIIPQIYAKKNQVIAFDQNENGLHIAMVNPGDVKIRDFLFKKRGLPIKVFYTTKRSINSALTLYKKELSKVFDEIVEDSVKNAIGNKTSDPSIIKIVDAVINYAYDNKASDIHIEPFESESIVRFRIDGVLHDVVKIPQDIHTRVVTRVKVLSNLRTDEHQSAQDGKMSIKLEDENLDIRVSIVPITNGEKIVMRLLSEKSRQFSLHELGFLDSDLLKVVEGYKKPHGMILSTGPTGCGKTTSLYAILKLLNKKEVNIMTIEDPVEYEIERVNQIQVNNATNLTFASGLRSIVRQDPDIILVGEIRDSETADISVNAAMTGHLVLSTLHTNDAATSIPRLLDLGVEPFLLASTLNVIIAQRLVRKICIKCRVSEEYDLTKTPIDKGDKPLEGVDNIIMQARKYFNNEKILRIYKGKGCELCHNTGYLGRIGIFEVMVIDDILRSAITTKKTSEEIKNIAIRNGMTSMFDDGLKKVREGITSLDEVLRVTKE